MKNLKNYMLTIGLFAYFIPLSYAQFGTGAVIEPGKLSKLNSPDKGGLGFSAQIPATFSLKSFAPYVKSQGIYPSCSGWAVAYQALSIQYARANNITNKNHITANAFCPYFVYNKIKPEIKNCSGGKPADEMIFLMIDEGAKRFYLPLMGCGTNVSNEFSESAKNHRIKDGYRLFDWPADIKIYNNDLGDAFKRYFAAKPPKDLKMVKEFVASGYPVIFAAALPTSFYSVSGDIWEPTAAEKANPASAIMDNTGAHRLHAMTIVGYDDAKYGGAFEVMNSWSENWGNKGFFWIRYEDFSTYAYSALAMELYPVDPLSLTKTGCVWGDCNNGYGFFRSANKHTYEGYFKNGVYNGYGIYTWPTGAAYAGMWKEGKREGEATQYYPDGEFGQCIYSADKVLSGYTQFKAASGDEYKGTIKNGLIHGWGSYQFVSGDKYTGFIDNGKFQGLGKYVWANGTVYMGYWENGKRNGKGMLITPDKKAMAGDWVNETFISGKSFGFASESEAPTPSLELKSSVYLSADCISGNCLNGNGSRNMGNGTKYEGDFTDGLEDGRGMRTYTDGVYDGMWKQGNKNGVGILKLNSGTNIIAEFKKDKVDGYAFFYDNAGKMFVDIFNNGARISRLAMSDPTASTGTGIQAMQKTFLGPDLTEKPSR